VHKRIISAVKRVESVSDNMSYIILRGCWCHNIVLKVYASTEDKTDDLKETFYEVLELCLIYSRYTIPYENSVGRFQYQKAGKTFLNRQLGMKMWVYTRGTSGPGITH
jgi:hypothetical protein